MHQLIQEFIQDERGASMIEYGLIAASIALALVAILTSLGGIVTETFESVTNSIGSKENGNGGNGDACNTAPTTMGPALTLVAMLAAARRRR